METKWRACVRKGIQASTEIQAAARSVETENKQLRTLLMAKGVSKSEIDGQVAGYDGSSDATTASACLSRILNQKRSCSEVSKCDASTPSTNMSEQTNVLSHRGGDAGSREIFSRPTQGAVPGQIPILMPILPTGNFDRVEVKRPSEVFINETWRSTSNPAIPIPNEESSMIDLTMPCSDAASLLISMNQDLSAQDAILEIGCGTNADCKVEKIHLFELMDRYV